MGDDSVAGIGKFNLQVSANLTHPHTKARRGKAFEGLLNRYFK